MQETGESIMTKQAQVNVIGAGLAGVEAAWQIVQRDVQVNLYEMKAHKKSPAHHSELFAELVCSNSLRSNSIDNGVGLLKEELRRLDSLVLHSADLHAVPAGGALAVDRIAFSQEITDRIKAHPLIKVIEEEVTEIPEGTTVIATGPLTSDAFASAIRGLIGDNYLYFYDAAAPIIARESIDFSKVYIASRYDKGEAAYINCPLIEEEFAVFYGILISAERVQLHDFEKAQYFEGCMPIEVLAARNRQTLLFGAMKPVGLVNPYTGKLPYAVVQLRQENQAGSMYNIVGFQTNLKWPDQKRLINSIPGLEEAEILRYGVMHRNTYINSPGLLNSYYQFKADPRLFFAGQITGVEGYVESAASGLVAGINAAAYAKNERLCSFPIETMIGAMANYIADNQVKQFQPMNANFGLVPPIATCVKGKKEKNQQLANIALKNLQSFAKEYL